MSNRLRLPTPDELQERFPRIRQDRTHRWSVPTGLAEHFTPDEWVALNEAAEAAGLEQEQVIHRWVMHRR